MISYSEAKLLSKKQTNVYEVDNVEFQGEQECKNSIPKRHNVQGIFFSNMWPVDVWYICTLQAFQ